MERIDIVLFGATGFTGKFVARYLEKLYKKENFSWAIAGIDIILLISTCSVTSFMSLFVGRSRSKLTELINDLKKESGNNDLDKIELIIVDINAPDTIVKMCERAKVIINCVGPYRFYGEAVIKECVKTKTHHVDVSGEPEFLERMQLDYNNAALESNVFIVGSCGFDSVPADLGFLYTKKEFPGDLNHVESYLTVEPNGGSFAVNYATYESAVYGVGEARNLGRLRKQLFKTKLPHSPYKPMKKLNRLGYFYENYLKKYVMQFIGSDKSVVQRSEYSNYTLFNQRPVQYYAYFTLDKLNYIYSFVFWGLIFATLAKYNFGRKFLLKHYSFFTRGLVTKGEKSLEELEKPTFKMQFFGQGWKDKIEDANQVHNEPPDTSIVTQITGPELGYISTSIIVSNCALMLLRESDKIKVKGGVLTPAIAFGNTSLIDKLQENGIKFEKIK